MCIDSYSGSLSSSKKRDYFPCPSGLGDSYDHMASSVLMQLPSASLPGTLHASNDGGAHLADQDCSDYRRPRPPSNGFMGKLVSCYFFYNVSYILVRNLLGYLQVYCYLGSMTCYLVRPLPGGWLWLRSMTETIWKITGFYKLWVARTDKNWEVYPCLKCASQFKHPLHSDVFGILKR